MEAAIALVVAEILRSGEEISSVRVKLFLDPVANVRLIRGTPAGRDRCFVKFIPCPHLKWRPGPLVLGFFALRSAGI